MMSYQNNIPQLRFAGFVGEWEKSKLNKFASLNPKNSELPDSFIYIDLESVTDGLLIKESVISKNEAPSRAQRILKDKDILYQTVRPYQKNNLYFDKVGDYVASTGYAQIRTINDSQFLFQFLHTEKFVANVMLRCTGTSYPAINSSDLSCIEISFPSLPEQQKIASFLCAVDEKIQQLSRKKELLEQYKKGVMQQLFSGKLRFKDENGKDYADWEEKKLGEIANVSKLAGYEFTKHIIYEDKGEIIALRGLNIKKNKLDLNDVKYIDNSELSKLSRSKLYIDDLMFTYVGTIGEVALINENDKYYLAPNVSRIRVNTKIITPNYILQYFNVSKFRNNEIEKFISSSSQPALSMENVRKFKIQVPSLPEQQKIANFLSSIDAKIESTSQQITQTQSFKKGLLQQMFV